MTHGVIMEPKPDAAPNLALTVTIQTLHCGAVGNGGNFTVSAYFRVTLLSSFCWSFASRLFAFLRVGRGVSPLSEDDQQPPLAA